MERASKLSAWLEHAGFDRPCMRRLRSDIDDATALFDRSDKPDDLDLACALTQFSLPSLPEGLAARAVNAVEGDQWLVMLMANGVNHVTSSPSSIRSQRTRPA